MTSIPISSVTHPDASLPVLEFGVSADGLRVARVGDTAFAMVPKRDGQFFLATGWRLSKPTAEWIRDDFYGHGGNIVDEEAFRAHVAELAEHERQKAGLHRQDLFVHSSTPWGSSQGITQYADGVTFHTTAGHGGFHLAAEYNRRVPSTLRTEAGWYEEDAEWAAVAVGLPDLFTAYERRLADDTIRNAWPEAWEALHERALLPGESRELDRKAFEQSHRSDWIVISAIRSDHHPGCTEVIATRGGQRGGAAARRRFLLASADYHIGPFGFVINEAKHATYDGPSSFVGWSGGAERAGEG